uniref:Oxysterol-binding protein n=1 Tax=Gouania willdenowi TaxID=441366 RepID=A0A8C5GI87_GOUWI
MVSPPLNSSQSLISILDRSPVSTFKPGHSRNNSNGSSKFPKQSGHWEVMEDLQNVDAGPAVGSSLDLSIPGICEGYLMKRRKYPLKGWHRVKLNGCGKLHGSLDVSTAVMSVNKKCKRIDLDAGDSLYHLKAKSHDLFYIWLTKLCAHRVYRKNEALSVHRGVLHALSLGQSSIPTASNFSQQSRATVSFESYLARCQAELTELAQLINKLHWLEGGLPITSTDLGMRISMQNLSLEKPKKKSGRTIGHSRTLSRVEAMGGMYNSSHLSTNTGAGLAASVQSIPDYVYTQLSNPQVTSPEAKKLHTDICLVSQRVHTSLKSVHDVLTLERERLRQAWTGPEMRQNTSQQLATLCSTLSEVRRRKVLPAPGADNSHIGIMTILYNNIGKDLSRVSMPVALNEPVCLLQRLSEELEYSELLDIANYIDNPYERMVYVATFSHLGYAWASWRFRYKPFNPVLGETYENHREDRGFRYVSEQVSHHPPVSACHAESENFTFWQDQRWKNKFWGKSVEIISSGQVNVALPRYGDHYEWNKAVTCIHNVLSQQRWLEHYGEVVIKNTKSDVCTCKITFVKSRYWSSDNSKNEVQGVVLDRAGQVVHRFGGLWHEGIFCDTLATPKCIWKPNVQPDDQFDFYGFSRYARELNELTPDLRNVLPPTDTRYQTRPEDGKVAEADKKKDEVEEKQRERRKEMAKKGEEHVPRFFRKSVDEANREVWLTNGTYWKLRKDPGFSQTENLDLW